MLLTTDNAKTTLGCLGTGAFCCNSLFFDQSFPYFNFVDEVSSIYYLENVYFEVGIVDPSVMALITFMTLSLLIGFVNSWWYMGFFAYKTPNCRLRLQLYRSLCLTDSDSLILVSPDTYNGKSKMWTKYGFRLLLVVLIFEPWFIALCYFDLNLMFSDCMKRPEQDVMSVMDFDLSAKERQRTFTIELLLNTIPTLFIQAYLNHQLDGQYEWWQIFSLVMSVL